MGGGKRELPHFPLPIVPRALSIFRLLLFLLEYPAGASAEEREGFPLFAKPSTSKFQFNFWFLTLDVITDV